MFSTMESTSHISGKITVVNEYFKTKNTRTTTEQPWK